MRKINIALLGCGVVGSGTYNILKDKRKEFKTIYGIDIAVTKILVKNIAKDRKGIDKNLLTTDFNSILNDQSIQIVVEVMGSIDLAREYTLKAINAKKNVVSANKDLIALSFAEILAAAKNNNVVFAYEASVAGAIPIIGVINRSLVGKTFNKVLGILNGTTNYILTKMTRDGLTYKEALQEATELGYAEIDPTSDVMGLDSARKIAILSSIAFKREVTFNDVHVEGITKITAEDIDFAKLFGYTIKLLAIGEETEGKIIARVHPTLVSNTHPLANVNDSYNSIYLNAESGDTMLYGKGAGDLPTGSAVVGDIVDACRLLEAPIDSKNYSTCYRDVELGELNDINSKMFLKINTKHEVGTLAKITSKFEKNNINIESITQTLLSEDDVVLCILTEKCSKLSIEKALESIEKFDVVKSVISTMMVL